MFFAQYLWLRRTLNLCSSISIEGYALSQNEIEEYLSAVEYGRRLVFVYETIERDLVGYGGEYRYLDRVDCGQHDSAIRVYNLLSMMQTKLLFGVRDALGGNDPTEYPIYIRRWIRIEVY